MEINITRFFVDADPFNYSRSQAEAGKNAGPDSWNNAVADSSSYMDLLDTPEKCAAFKSHMRDMGFSEADELDLYPHEQLVALFMQLIAGDIRESGITENSADEFAAWEERSDGGGRMFRGDDGQVYYYLGS
jgi:hypothetical protein